VSCLLSVAVNLIFNPSENESEHKQILDALGKKFENAEGLEEWVKKTGGESESG
jgi:hypothetical protein